MSSARLAEVAAGAVDLGDTFRELLRASPRFEAAEAELLRSRAVVFVPGFAGNLVTALEPVRAANLPGGYFDDQISWLEDPEASGAALDVRRARMETEGGIAGNRERLAEMIRGIDKPVILIGHSKGGLEILDLLVRHPELRGKIVAWAALQSPFLGSPVADLASGTPALRVPLEAGLRLLGGGGESLRDLSTAGRRAYHELHRQQVAAALSSTPHLLLVTWIPVSMPTGAWEAWSRRVEEGTLLRSDSYTLYKVTRDWLLRGPRGVHSDGMVPVDSALLPGSRFVGIEGPDHAATVCETGFSVYGRGERVALVAATIKTLLRLADGS